MLHTIWLCEEHGLKEEECCEQGMPGWFEDAEPKTVHMKETLQDALSAQNESNK